MQSLSVSNIVTGRQLRAARVLAGLTQRQLAIESGFAARGAKYWESGGDELHACQIFLLQLSKHYAATGLKCLRPRDQECDLFKPIQQRNAAASRQFFT